MYTVDPNAHARAVLEERLRDADRRRMVREARRREEPVTAATTTSPVRRHHSWWWNLVPFHHAFS
jgi:hypothetical protein